MSFETSMVISQGALVLIVASAAVLDMRTGKIPNWLTLPAMAAGPLFWFFAMGTFGAVESAAGIFLCGLPPFLAYRAGGMPGGDLKLFAAVGGIVGPVTGIEIEFFAMLAAGLFGVVLLAYRGKLRETFGAAYLRLRNKALPARYEKEVPEIERTSIRIGPFVLVGSLAAVLQHHRLWVEYFDG